MDLYPITKTKQDSNKIADLGLQNDDYFRHLVLKDDIRTDLNLLIGGASSEQSVVDENLSPNVEDKKANGGDDKKTALLAKLQQQNEENQMLKYKLSQISSDYNALQMHMMTLQKEAEKKLSIVPKESTDLVFAAGRAGEKEEHSQYILEENNLEEGSNEFCVRKRKDVPQDNSNNGSPDRGLGSSSKLPSSSAYKNNAVDQTEVRMNKARVAIKIRSEMPVMADGCHWRKYGKSMAKGNPNPRSYYRCTMLGNCRARKQVQRSAEDKSILVTTYEGNHNHPLPSAAKAIASTTQSAASMLVCGTMPRRDEPLNNNFCTRTMLLLSSGIAQLSASAPFPTIILDLTKLPNLRDMQRPPFHVPVLNTADIQNASLPQICNQGLLDQPRLAGLQMVPQGSESGQLSRQQERQYSLADPMTVATAIAADPNLTRAIAAANTCFICGVQPHNVGNHNNNGTSSTTNNTTSNGDK